MFIDALGRSFDFSHPPQRIVSLVPSYTETLHALGLGDAIAGVTSYCIFPEEARTRAADVGGTKNPKVEHIRELQPDVVYMNLEENLRRHGEEIEKFAPVVVTEPKNVDDVRDLILMFGEIHDVMPRAQELLRELDEARAALAALAHPFRFACPIWKDPWMWCGADTYVSSLVAEAGGTNAVVEARYPGLTVDEVSGRGIDVVFLPDEPFVFDAEDAEEMRKRTRVRVVGPFPGHLFTWHGVRTIEGIRFLTSAAFR